MSAKRQRLYFIIFCVVFISGAAAISLTVFNKNIVFFFTPTEIATGKASGKQVIRLGGLVKKESVKPEGKKTTFTVTDMQNDVQVEYSGLLPDLFREGQGVVAEGSFENNKFIARKVLAKHDENYMPPEVAKALKDSGHWESDYKKEKR